jgi:uncharacterized membrane protein YukC
MAVHCAVKRPGTQGRPNTNSASPVGPNSSTKQELLPPADKQDDKKAKKDQKEKDKKDKDKKEKDKQEKK